MIKYDSNFGGSLVVAIIFILIIASNIAFADDSKKIQTTGFMDFNMSVHSGFGDNYDGIAFGGGPGAEVLYVVNDGFAFGLTGKTNINYDNYVQYPEGTDDVIVDDYGLWTIAGGGIVYMGDVFYLAYMAMANLWTFHEDTYLSTPDGDIGMKKAKYHIDSVDYILEIGARLSYHGGIYMDITTHLVETEIAPNRYQIYVGLKYFI